MPDVLRFKLMNKKVAILTAGKASERCLKSTDENATFGHPHFVPCYHCALVLQGSKIVDARGRRL